MSLMDRETIIELLTQLGRRLTDRNIEAELYIVGGTAMILAYNRTRVTADIDAITERQEEVELEARNMAATRRDLPDDWLNGRVKPMLPRIFDKDQLEVLSVPGLSVSVASPEHMLAMKVRAARSEQDMNDVWELCKILEVQSIRQVFNIAESVWGPGMLRDESVFLTQEFLEHKGLQLDPSSNKWQRNKQLPGLRIKETQDRRDSTTWQCPGITSNGTQCIRWVPKGTTCWQH